MKLANESARPIIVRLVEEGPWPLSHDEAATFARWVIMLIMTYEFSDLETVTTTQEERSALRLNLTPPDNFGVFIAPYSGTNWAEVINHRALCCGLPDGTVPERPNGQTSVLTLGKTAVNIIGGRFFDVIEPLNYAALFHLQTVWPVIPTKPAPAADDAALIWIATVGTSESFVGFPGTGTLPQNPSGRGRYWVR